MATFDYNEEAVRNLKLRDTSVLDRLIDFESAREAHSKKRNTPRKTKRMTIGEAVATFVQDGDIITDGGFSYVRTPHQAFHEVIRQGKKEFADDRITQYESEFLSFTDVWIIPTIHTPGRRCAGLTDSMTAL